jgi:hypothetical protein
MAKLVCAALALFLAIGCDSGGRKSGDGTDTDVDTDSEKSSCSSSSTRR